GAINVLTEGGPFNSTSNIVYYLYEQGFVFFQIGSASAVSVIVFIATALLTWFQFKFGERFVHYGEGSCCRLPSGIPGEQAAAAHRAGCDLFCHGVPVHLDAQHHAEAGG